VRRQLQHSRSLTSAQMCQQDNISVRKLEGVMVTIRLTLVDLREFGHLVPEVSGEHEPSFAPYLVVKSEFSARKHTNSYAPVTYRSKTARDGMIEAS
jgi:hypothetical protein